MKSTAPKEQSLHFWLVLECVSYERRPFVMISRCNEVRANNSCRELLVLAPVLRKLSIGTKVYYQVNVLTILKKDLLCLLLQQEEDSLIKVRINFGIPLLIQGGANYSEPKNLFRSWGGPFPTQNWDKRSILPTLNNPKGLRSF